MAERDLGGDELRAGFVCLDGWAGRAEFPVTIFEELKRSYRVRFDKNANYGRWVRKAGQVGLVPKRAVKLAAAGRP